MLAGKLSAVDRILDPSLYEITVYFVTDAASALPSAEDWPAVWTAQQEWKAAKAAHEAAEQAAKKVVRFAQLLHTQREACSAVDGPCLHHVQDLEADKVALYCWTWPVLHVLCA